MHDFFIDRIIKIKNKEELLSMIIEKSKFGGGSIRGVQTLEIEGGNAVNVAFCLAKLGLDVHLFTIADNIGKKILLSLFKDLKNVKLRLFSGRPGYTTSLEFFNSSSNELEANIMISDVGDNSDFGPDKFCRSTEKNILEAADAVIVLNWASNLKGTSLLEYVFKNSPNAFHFIDPADINSRRKEFCSLLLECGDIIDILSINENECNSLLLELNYGGLILKNDYDSKEIKLAAKTLAKNLKISVDLHTKNGSVFSDGKDIYFIESWRDIIIKSLTGAGDSWDAADILGHLSGLNPNERLFFANMFAALYISQEDRQLITLANVIQFYNKIYKNKS
ncbi:MAG: carbohydrate kinase family protein [Nitrososphaerales archaeon]|jgi:ribokinase